jgi:hypothetical protein
MGTYTLSENSDIFTAGPEDDVINGLGGNDQLHGDGGNDTIDGGAGDDALYGDDGNDVLLGRTGNDLLVGGTGTDTLIGGGGTNTFQDTMAGFNGDHITDLSIGDRIQITDLTDPTSIHTTATAITYSGGSITVDGLGSGRLIVRALQGSGYEIRLQAPAQNDFNGDGRSDILWRHDDGRLVDWLGTASGGFAGNGAQSSTSVAVDWQVAGTGDFNGDGRVDILWRSASTGRIADWLGTKAGGFIGNGAHSTNAVSTDWQVAGIGDFNGDGRSDILWRAGDGRIADWLGTTNGGFTGNGAHSANAVSNDWQVAGTGDFNGDGNSDILWRSASTGRIADWLGTDNGGFIGNGANSSTPLSTDWEVAGVGDFNGDGRSDFLLRNTTTGEVTDWLGTQTGGFVDNSAHASATLSTEWQVAAIGDYNGDSIDDVLWRNTSTGQVTDWLGNTSGGFSDNSAHASNLVDTHWHIQPEANLL